MSEEHSYIPRFESANAFTDFLDDEPEAEDSDNDATIDTSSNKAVPKSAGSKRKSVSKAINDTEGTGDKRRLAHGKGKRKIEIEYVKDKKSRAVTFTKRKAGIFTKARELSTLTGSSVLLVVVSESGVVYTYSTEKFQPMVTQDAGKNMIAACLSGKVNLDERFNSSSFRDGTSTTGPKKGGNILLKDAFGTALPPSSSSTTSAVHHDHEHAGPSAPFRSNAVSGNYAGSSASEETHGGVTLPPLPDPIPQYQPYRIEEPHTNELELVKVPRLHAKRPRDMQIDDSFPPSMYDYHQQLDPTTITEEQEEDDLSEGECEAQMRKLRRSLSIERRFEKAAEEERPRLLRHDGDGGTGREERKPTKEEIEREEKERMREMKSRGWSFTAAADAWENFPRPFGKGNTNQRHGRDANGPATVLQRYGPQRAHPQARNTVDAGRRRTAQTVTLPELPS